MTVEPIEGTEPTAESPGDESRADATQSPAEADATRAPDTLATSDPSLEAAVGASGARPLGAADALATSAGAAVDATDGSSDASSQTDGAPPVGASTSEAGSAAPPEDEAATSDSVPEAPASGADAAPQDTAERDAPSESAPSDAVLSPDAETASVAEPSATATDTDTDTPAGGSTADTSDFADAPPAEDEDPSPPVDERPEPTTMEELLSEQTDEIRSLKHGDVVEGQVVRIDKDEILVDIGAKSEGVVSNRELYGRNAESQPELNIGDTVLVYVLQPESNEGHAVLSLRRAGLERKWRSMQEQLDEGVIIEAPVIDHNKGGLIVDCGIRGFVPISQIVDFPRRPQNEQPRDAAQEIAEKLQPYVGRKLRLKILEVNRKANRLILSEKVALYEERREKRDELFSSLTVGQKVTGSVRSIAPFGVFVDLGGIDGLVHKSELSWNKVNNPEAGYKVGEEVEAEVIDINHERGRISLSIRRLQPDPWHSTVADLKVGDVIDGTVTKIVNFGSFVRVRDGLEGLIHISELSHQRVAHPGDVVHEGQNLKLKVISLDSERHRLGLSLKQAEEAPARPAPSEPRERRPRSSGPSYDPSQAVQEPEEGIDNTLAAAFAQVRMQMAESEGTAEPLADQPAVEAAVEERPNAEAVADVLAQAPDTDDAPVSQAGEASALEVAPADDAPADDASADAGPGQDALTEDGPATGEIAPTAPTEPAAMVDSAPSVEGSATEDAAEATDDTTEPAADTEATPGSELAADTEATPGSEPAADTAAVEAPSAEGDAPTAGAEESPASEPAEDGPASTDASPEESPDAVETSKISTDEPAEGPRD